MRRRLPQQRFRAPGVTLAEVIVAMGILAVALLAVIGHSTLLAAASQKGDDQTVAGAVARSCLDRVAQQAFLDQPAGERDRIWEQNDQAQPMNTLTETVGVTDYQVDIFVYDVRNETTGQTLGTGLTGAETPNTRLKSVEAVVTWWDPQQKDRLGYGKLELRAARLVKVTRAES